VMISGRCLSLCNEYKWWFELLCSYIHVSQGNRRAKGSEKGEGVHKDHSNNAKSGALVTISTDESSKSSDVTHVPEKLLILVSSLGALTFGSFVRIKWTYTSTFALLLSYYSPRVEYFTQGWEMAYAATLMASPKLGLRYTESH